MATVWKRIWRRRQIELDMDAEMRFHMDAYAADLVRGGMDTRKAARLARLEFGGCELAKEDCRQVLGLRVLSDLRQDVRYAARGLVRRPGFTAAAAVTMALGIGAASAIFSAFDETLWRPLPVGQPDEVVALYNYSPKAGAFLSSSFPDYLDFRAQSRSLSGIAAYFRYAFNLSTDGHAERVAVEAVSTNYFDLLRLPPVIGRAFDAGDEERHPAVMLGERMWRSRFAADPAIVGKTIRLEDRPFVVVGIVPARFHGVNLNWGDPPQLWIPMGAAMPLVPNFQAADVLHRRAARFLLMVGRRRPDVPVARVDAEMRTLAWKLAQAEPATNRDVTATVFPASHAKFWPAYRGTVTEWMGVFGGGGGLLLLLACATVSSLLVERGMGRRREMAVRLAIGGTRGRLVRQLLTEGVLLAIPSFALALLVAAVVQKLLLQFPSAFGLGLQLELTLEYRVLLMAGALSLLTAALFSLTPAWQATRADVGSWLKGAAGGGSAERSPRVRQALVVAQVAFSMMLLVGGGLFGRSLWKAYATDPGFRADRLLALTFSPPADFASRRAAFTQALVRGASAQSGVDSATIAWQLPLSGSRTAQQVQDPGASSATSVEYNVVGADYLRTAGIALSAGRDFTLRDDQQAPKAAIVNRALARSLWGQANPLGRRLLLKDRRGAEAIVVGVVGDARFGSLWKQPQPYLYLCAIQWPEPAMHLLVRTSATTEEMIPAMRRTWDGLAPEAPLYEVRTGKELVDATLAPQRLAAGLLAAFGLAAIVLASVGLYGVMAYAVSRRTREIGIRIAIGARPASMVRQTLGSALALAAMGVVVGAAGSAALMRLVAPEIRGVSPHDALTFGAVAALLGLVALSAALGPAVRASRIDPVRALRCE